MVCCVTLSMGQYGRPLELFQDALSFAGDLDVPGQTAATLNNLALTCALLNRDEEAIGLLTEGLVHFETVGDKQTIGTIQMNLGVIHSSLGQLDAAHFYLKDALEAHRAAGHTHTS